jgi:hypothetical protein
MLENSWIGLDREETKEIHPNQNSISRKLDFSDEQSQNGE